MVTESTGRTRGSRRGWAFISYAHDDVERVRAIVGHLQRRKIDVWWDEDLVPGDRWGQVLLEKLQSASCVIVVWSDASVRSIFVEGEARAALDHAQDAGRLLPVLIDASAAPRIPLPFNTFQYTDLTEWNGSYSLLKSLIGRARALVNRPSTSEEQWGDSLRRDWSVVRATDAAAEMGRITKRISQIGEVLLGDDEATAHLRAALVEVHKTVEVVDDAVTAFLSAGLGPGELDIAPYLQFERGQLVRRIRDGRGHCDLIALHYSGAGGVRPWLQTVARQSVVDRADEVFEQLALADGDLFSELGSVGEALTNESRVIVNLLVAGQHDVARQRVAQGRERLALLEAELAKDVEALQALEQALGFAFRPVV